MIARRHRAPGVQPLELWDALITSEAGEQPLYLLPRGEQASAIAQLVRQLAEGSARRLRARSRLPRLQIDEITLAGGGADRALVSALEQAGFSARIAPEPLWIGEPGGRLLAATLGSVRGAVMDVGQTAVKYSDAEGRARLVRSFEALPLESDAEPALLPLLRAKTLTFLATLPRARARPDVLVLALPCEIDDALCVAGCSYPWPAGDPTLIAELLHEAGLRDVPTLVLNDAELAALSVDLRRSRSRATLVLTVGLGLGAAYLPPR